MSEQQSGAGYPQQPASAQPQQPYQQAYASPQAQYQAQQQYAAYAQPGPTLFDRFGVPFMPAVLGLCGLGALILGGLIAGTSSGSSGDGTYLAGFVRDSISGGVLSLLVATIVVYALAMFAGEKLRPLWKALTIVGGSLFVAQLLYVLLALPDSDDASDASAWIGAILVVAAYGLFVSGALLVPTASAAVPAAAPQAYPTGQQPAVQPQAPQAAPGQQGQWPQAPQQ